MPALAGKRVLVTGGSRGLGRAMVKTFAAEGARVAFSYANDEAGAAESAREAGDAKAFRVSVLDAAGTDAMIEGLERDWGGLDILVNNAGVGVFTDVAAMTPAQWADVIETNLTGVFNACHVALPHMRRRGGGFIINISSLSGKNPFAGAAAYCASKAGLNAFSEALMQEVRYDGIRVSYVMPGSVATGFGGGDPSKGDDWKIAPDEVAEVVVNLLKHEPRSLPSRVELRPSRPPRK